jgi:hypothetical protein
MLKASSDRLVHGNECLPVMVLTFSSRLSGAYVALFVSQAGNPKRQRASQVAGFAAAMIGAAALLGWWVSLPLLSSWVSGFPRTRPMTALLLVALGLALMRRSEASRFGAAVGLAAATAAALTLLGVDFGINAWLVPQGAVVEPGPASFRIMIGIPLVMALVGSSLSLSGFEKRHFAALVLAGLGGIMPIFALLTYVAGVPALTGPVRTPALPSVVGLLCVAAGIVLRIGTRSAIEKARPLWHLLMMLAWAINTTAAARRVHGISHHRCAARSGPQGPDERGTYVVGGR